VTLMEYTKCRAESCRVVPVAQLVLLATLMGVTSIFELDLSCAVVRLLALMEHTELQVWDSPSGICAPSYGGQLSALVEHTIETLA